MAYIIVIESTGYNCSIAIINEEGKVHSCVEERSTEQYIHTEKLHRFIGNCLQDLSLTFSDLSAVAVSQGPGSYTGLRYGVSAAKGLCSALDLPLIALNPFQAMVENYKAVAGENTSTKVAAMIDARRHEVFIQTFDFNAKTNSEVTALIVDENHNLQNHTWIGDGADKFVGLEGIGVENISFFTGIFTSAKYHALEASQKFNAQQFEDRAYFVPFYLKDFVATKPKTKFSIKGIPKIGE